MEYYYWQFYTSGTSEMPKIKKIEETETLEAVIITEKMKEKESPEIRTLKFLIFF